MTRKILTYEIFGAVWAIFLGSFLHFAYALRSDNKLVALFAAVNESTWEHLKLGFWPLLFWGILEYFVFGKQVINFFLAKFASLFLFTISVPILFYSYTVILGTDFLLADISIFIIGILLGQFVSYKIMTSRKNLGGERIAQVLIALMTLAFLLLTFFPPHIFLFQDPISGTYGIR